MQHKSSKLNEQQAQEQQLDAQAQTRPKSKFDTPEELLRHDAAQTEVPAQVRQRLEASLELEPKPTRPWWRRWLGGGR